MVKEDFIFGGNWSTYPSSHFTVGIDIELLNKMFTFSRIFIEIGNSKSENLNCVKQSPCKL